MGGDHQTAPIGRPLADPLVVRVTDPQNRPVAQLRVAFVVTAGGGRMAPDTALTHNDGLATSRWTLGTTLGTQTVDARVADGVSATLIGTASASPDTTKRLPPTTSRVATTTRITAISPEPSVPAQQLTVTFSVTAEQGGMVTGSVTVSDGSASCVAAVAEGACRLVPLGVGSRTVTAAYSGSTVFAPSSGTGRHEVVRAGTATTLSSHPNPSREHKSITFTTGVTSAFGSVGGVVRLVEGRCDQPTSAWGTQDLDDAAQATLSTKDLPPGTHYMVACYLGNSTFAPSESAVLSQEVTSHDDD